MLMSHDSKPANLHRRQLLQAALGSAALGASGLPLLARAAGKSRNTDTVRLAWGKGGLPGIARTRGEFEKTLARDGIKVQWIGPFPNHAPSLQAVTGGSADFGFGGSTTPALAAMIAGSPLVFTQFAVVEPRSTAIIAKDGSGINKVADLVGKTVAVNRSGLGNSCWWPRWKSTASRATRSISSTSIHRMPVRLFAGQGRCMVHVESRRGHRAGGIQGA
jgi:sulfonate transport system substrate-binding protein